MTAAELVDLRSATGLSQAKFGKLIGKSRETISRYERGIFAIHEAVDIAIRHKISKLPK
jgi:transcriptional regulator with XRE-family HTH domain